MNAVVRGNGRIALSCVTDANPPPSHYQFYRDGVYLRTSLTGKYGIHRARYYDAGSYLCVPINRLGTGSNSSVNIYVSGELGCVHNWRTSTVVFTPAQNSVTLRHRYSEKPSTIKCPIIRSSTYTGFWYLKQTCVHISAQQELYSSSELRHRV